MPHFGQSPGLSDSTPGHIGQKYFVSEDGLTSASAEWSWPPQQDFFSCEWFMENGVLVYGCTIAIKAAVAGAYRAGFF